MTDIRNELPLPGDQAFNILLTDKGRKLFFDKECLEKITILRRINSGEWQTIGRDVKAPFLDSDQISTPAEITYKILFEHSGERIVNVHLPGP